MDQLFRKYKMLSLPNIGLQDNISNTQLKLDYNKQMSWLWLLVGVVIARAWIQDIQVLLVHSSYPTDTIMIQYTKHFSLLLAAT